MNDKTHLQKPEALEQSSKSELFAGQFYPLQISKIKIVLVRPIQPHSILFTLIFWVAKNLNPRLF